MENNKNFELNDDALDEVAGGVGSNDGQSVTYNGTTWTVGQTVSLPYCSVRGCSSRNSHYDGVITRFGA